MIRSHMTEKQSNWEERLPFVEFAYNNSKNSTTGKIPFKEAVGYDPIIPLELDLNNFKGKTKVSMEMLAQMQEEIKECRKNIERAQTRDKLYADQ